MPSEKIKIHNKLLTKVAVDFLGPNVNKGVNFEKFKGNVKSYFDNPRQRNLNHAQEYFKELEAKGELKLGKYDVLIELVEDIDIEIVELIKEEKRKIDKLDKESEGGEPTVERSPQAKTRSPSNKSHTNMASSREEREKLRIHNELKETLALDYLIPKIRDGYYFNKFKMRTKNYLQGLRHDYDQAQTYFDELESAGHLAVGKYNVLRDIVKGIDVKIDKLIDECEENLRNIEDRTSEKKERKTGSFSKKPRVTNRAYSEESEEESKERRTRSRGSVVNFNVNTIKGPVSNIGNIEGSFVQNVRSKGRERNKGKRRRGSSSESDD